MRTLTERRLDIFLEQLFGGFGKRIDAEPDIRVHIRALKPPLADHGPPIDLDHADVVRHEQPVLLADPADGVQRREPDEMKVAPVVEVCGISSRNLDGVPCLKGLRAGVHHLDDRVFGKLNKSLWRANGGTVRG